MTTGGAAPAAPAAPPLPPAFRGIDDLGPARVVAAVPGARRAGYSIGMFALWATSIFIAGFLVALIFSIILELDDVVILGIAAILWVAGAVVVVRWLRRKGAQVIVLFADGIAVGDGRSVRRWRWEDFASIERRPIVSKLEPDVPTDLASAAAIVAVLAAYRLTNRPQVRVDSYYWFFDRSGGSFSLDRWLPAVDQLGQAIDAEITDRLAPAARATLAGGGAVDFGQVALGSGTLLVPGQALPLGAVDRLEVEHDLVHVVAGGTRQAAVPVAGVRNLTLLVQLLGELRQGQSRIA